MSTRRDCGGLTKFEFVLTLAVIAVLVWFALERLQWVEEYSEMTVVDATVRNVASGLRYAMSEAIIEGREGSVGGWTGSNPATWLAQRPAGYLGEFAGTPAAVAAGDWWFDSVQRQLCYLPKLAAHLVAGASSGELCWRVEAAGGKGVTPASTRVVATPPYRWF